MWPLAVLLDDRINSIFYKEMNDHFAWLKKSDRNNKVTVLPRWP